MTCKSTTRSQARAAPIVARAAYGSTVIAAVFFLSLALSPSTLAGPPTHSPLPDPIGGHALNHACGVAADSEGNIYVSNAGESKVEVFDTFGGHIVSIVDVNEPCGLAVDSNGRLYVSESATGEVARYTPNVFPFSGTPTYGPPVIVNSSGNARGVAVDSFDDSFYVAEGNSVAVFKSDGTLSTNNEVQALEFPGSPSGGSYTLEFEGAKTSAIPFNAPSSGPGSVQEALTALPTIGVGNVTVAGNATKAITFIGALGATDTPQIIVDASGLEGSSAQIAIRVNGFNGHLGEGELSDASGVASYTSLATSNFRRRRYISVADTTASRIKVYVGRFENEPGGFVPGTLQLRRTIDGEETPTGELGLASGGAYLGVDGKSGHLFAYDVTHEVLNEFEATGQYFTEIESKAFDDAKPTAVAVDRSGGPNDGVVYVSAGPDSGAKVLAFGPVEAPSRSTLPEPPSEKSVAVCGTVVDSVGNVYVAGETAIRIYAPEPQLSGGKPKPLTTIEDPAKPCDLAVDSEGNLYVSERGIAAGGDEKVVLLEPQTYPPVEGTIYTKNPTPIETLEAPRGIAVNPANDHLFVVHFGDVREYGSAKEGFPLLKSKFCGLGGELVGIDVYGATGDVYVVESPEIAVCNSAGTTVLARIGGSGSLGGVFSSLIGVRIAVDQANGHVLVGNMFERGVVEEFEASGSFVGEFGDFQEKTFVVGSDLAIDNSTGVTSRNLYVAFDTPAGFDLTALGPLSYGRPPVVAVDPASEIDGAAATLNGSVDPGEVELSECRFDYLLDAEYEANLEAEEPAFEGALSKPCDKSLEEIGAGGEPVPVKATLTGLQVEGRYHYRLVAKNKYGEDEGEGRFGPPELASKSAQPILYREATLHATLDPWGLETQYRFEYGLTEAYGQSTPTKTLPASAGATDIEAFLTGLAADTVYHSRLVAENADAIIEGPDQKLRTLSQPPILPCPNATLRLENNSSHLSDCRAYELVTPADTRGATPRAGGNLDANFNDWLVTPDGPLAGESLAFFLNAALSASEGSGRFDGYRATRGSGGWNSQLFSPSFAQNGDFVDIPNGVASEQLFSLWSLGDDTLSGAFPRGRYLRTPGGFEQVGLGSLGSDLQAEGKYVSPGGTHVIFESKAQLEPTAPNPPIVAIYDRSPGKQTQVLSLLPGNVTPASDATYQGATPDGSSVVFSVLGDLYLRRNGTETLEVTNGPASFAGISDDGGRVFYTDNTDGKAASLWVFDVEGASATHIADNAKFANVSPDGSRAYFISAGDLELWDGAGKTFVAVLHPNDLQQSGQLRFPGTSDSDKVALDSWTADCVVKKNPSELSGSRAVCTSRTTPDGRFLIFQSHADLAPPYEGQGHSEIYRYDAEDGSLLCVSCDPSGAPATVDADLQSFGVGPPTQSTTLIPGITENGGEVFFQTSAALLPGDANVVLDVYAWQAEGEGGCERPSGCLALISSGQSDDPSYIYSMTPDGHDVFFSTKEKLIGSDILGSPSIYDARVEGGFPAEVEKEPCHGDACQPLPTPPPGGSTATTTVPNLGNVTQSTKRPCPKGRRSVKKNGRTRCVKRKSHGRKRASHKRRAVR
jgi:hypothetical protein